MHPLPERFEWVICLKFFKRFMVKILCLVFAFRLFMNNCIVANMCNKTNYTMSFRCVCGAKKKMGNLASFA